VNGGNVVDVSELYAASIFRVEACRGGWVPMYMRLYSEEKTWGGTVDRVQLGKEGKVPFMGHGLRRKPAFPA
jgi:hypothetical protein